MKQDKIKIAIFFTEDTSEPKFVDKDCLSLMRRINPVTLHIHQTDETTMKAVQLFASNFVTFYTYYDNYQHLLNGHIYKATGEQHLLQHSFQKHNTFER